MSALQGGPGLPLLLPAVYGYMVTRDHPRPEALSAEDVPHYEVKTLLEEVCVVLGVFMSRTKGGAGEGFLAWRAHKKLASNVFGV